ncbi:MAG: AbrB/MazE/SpoVT family DNA-binding domain-containing protein, partial [Thermoplasmatota archaeon]
MVYVTIKKVGNSLGVVLPAGFVRQNELSENEIVEIEVRRMN